MNLKQKMGLVMMVCVMAAAAAILWYVLLIRGKSSTQLDGTFVRFPDAELVQVTAA